MTWTRPENVPVPKIWRRFEGKQKENGISRKYWIQDLTEDLYETAVDYMCKYFLPDEALCKYSGVSSDPVAIEDFRYIWKDCCKQKLVLICFTEDDSGKPEIAGLNMTMRSYKGDKHEDFKIKSEAGKKVLGILLYIYEKVDGHELLNVDSHLTALGLLVLPKFRGDGVGTEILKSRRELCLAFGIPASFTLFTSNRSQHVARQAGFKDIVEVTYEELEQANPEWVFPGIQEVSKSQRHMYVVY